MKKRKYKRGNPLIKIPITSFLILASIFILIYTAGTQPTVPPSANNVATSAIATQSPAITPIADHTTVPTTVPTAVPTSVPEAPKELAIHQIGVSCANAYLLTYGEKVIFIDGGQSRHLKIVNNYLAEAGIEHIDVYICSHWHGDHDDNMEYLVNTYCNNDSKVLGPSQIAKGKNLKKGKYYQFKVDDKLSIGNLSITCIGPYELRQNGASNYDSLNFVIEYGDFKAFFTGDYVHSKQVMSSYSELIADCDVLQMPHHGLDPIYISEKALKLVNPKTILVPANTSGHTKKIVRKCGIDATVYDNGNGNIVVTTNGTTYSVKTSK